MINLGKEVGGALLFFETIRKNDGVARAVFRDLVQRDESIPGYLLPKAVFSENYLAAISRTDAKTRLTDFVIEGDVARIDFEIREGLAKSFRSYRYKIKGAESVEYVVEFSGPERRSVVRSGACVWGPYAERIDPSVARVRSDDETRLLARV